MAVFWLILSILCYNMADDVIAGSPRNLEHDYDEAFAFMTDNLKIEDTTIIPNPRNREKRDTAVAQDGSGGESTCKPGQKYRVVKQPTCLTADSVYVPAFKKCFLLQCYVPGMPDGPKGWNYYAYKHYLYKVYHALVIRRKKKCPKVKQTTTSKPTLSVTLSTKPVRLTIKPTLSSKTVSSTKSTLSSTTANLSTRFVSPSKATLLLSNLNLVSTKPPLLSTNASLVTKSALVNETKRPSSTNETDLTTRSILPRKATLLSTKLPLLSTKVTLATKSTPQLKTTKPKLLSTKLPLLSTKTPLVTNSTLPNVTTLSTK